jgi:adenylate kinase
MVYLEIKNSCITIKEMQEYTIIFIGKSGCGKGTQIKKLIELFNQRGEHSIEHLEAGQTLRDFINSGTYTSKLAQTNNTQGHLQPVFLAVWAWVNKMIETYSGQKVIILDGAPRKLGEAYVLDEMFDFYNRKNKYIIHIDISDTWANARLTERSRGDDTPEGIARRLDWFNTNSPEILDFFQKKNSYTILKINGEQDIEGVFQEICKGLNL